MMPKALILVPILAEAHNINARGHISGFHTTVYIAYSVLPGVEPTDYEQRP